MHPVKPCKGCPFARRGHESGGASPLTYIGQAHGPFFLPCHSADGYAGSKTEFGAPQCAGAAIYRANVGVADKMPDGLLALPADRDSVFNSPVELLSAHMGSSLEDAQASLLMIGVNAVVHHELNREGVRKC